MTTVNFLHLTDLHMGMKGSKDLWDNVEEQFLEDLGFVLGQARGLDLVLFTGDLTQRASAGEFEQVTQLLQRLWEKFNKMGHDPQFLAVPGNHDLVRPKNSTDADLLNLLHLWHQDAVQEAFWEKSASSQRKLIGAAFNNYAEWWKGLKIPTLTVRRDGLLPGDFAATFKKEGVQLGIVGLNSAFLQLTAGDLHEKLALHVKQLHAVCNDDTPAWARQHDGCLLMTHHPANWLNKDSQDMLQSEIHYPPERFALHLFGHMHEPKFRTVAIGSGAERRGLQGCSLFGMEPWGDGKVQRLHGYVLGEFDFGADIPTLRFWPRKAVKRDEGGWTFDRDQEKFALPRGQDSTKPIDIVRLKQAAQRSESAHGKAQNPQTPVIVPRQNRKYAALVGPESFTQVHAMMSDWIASSPKSNSGMSIRNIALDMELTWAFIRDHAMNTQWKPKMQWQSLMIDSTSEGIRRMSGPGSILSAETAERRETEIRRFFSGGGAATIRSSGLKFECRAYVSEPFMHGFLLDDRALFISFCSFDDKKWISSPYMEFLKEATPGYELDSKAATHFIKVFENWFKRQWTIARIIAP